MERPILFSTPMVQAIIALIKRMTRRTKGLKKVNEKPEEWEINGSWHDFNGKFAVEFRHKQTGEFVLIECPYGKLGDILWVRETWGNYSEDNPERNATYYLYRADYPQDAKGYWYEPEQINFCDFPRWRPSIHMPRVACRIRLKITDIRVERLQDISEEDAKAEGAVKVQYCLHPDDGVVPYEDELYGTYKQGFNALWDSINKDRGHGWDQNDWVWVVCFERVK